MMAGLTASLNVSAKPQTKQGEHEMKKRNSISPYPPYIVVEGDKVFSHGKYRGYVDKINNWGTDFLARCEDGKPNQFFATKTLAVFYIAK